MEQMELSFVIPAYNEEVLIEETLGTLDLAFRNKKIPYEIVVVDDGSKDKTYSNALRYSRRNGHVKVVRYAQNSGKGHAIKTGFKETNGDILVFTDGDMEVGMETLHEYVEALENADIAIASKWHPDSFVSMKLTRRLFSHSFNVLVRIFTGSNLRDTQVGLKAMSRSAANKVFPRLAVKRYAFDVELLAVAKLYKLKVVEMPVRLELNASFKLGAMIHMFIDLLGISYRLKLGYYRK
jgi:glycosyltransferase involved in cell wall biosynthesis